MAPMKADRESQLWSFGVICFAALSFWPVTAFVLASKVWHHLFGDRASNDTDRATVTVSKRTAIVTGGKMTKALCVCRQLKRSGCRVVLVETHKYWMVASRFSSCVDRFTTVPVPEKEPEAYLAALEKLMREEQADLFVPVSSPVASLYDARVGRVLPPHCRTLSCGEEMTAALDDKVTFASLATVAGLTVPDTRRITNKEVLSEFNDELRAQGSAATRYVLKNLAYDSMRRLDVFTLPCAPEKLQAYVADVDITAETPWLVQAFASGVEYSTCAIAHEGALTMYTDNVASISCFNYKYQGDPRLRKWVETFCRRHKVSGVVCIDFFITPEGVPLAIECNPRFSSNITNFYNSPPTIADAYLEPAKCVARGETVTPLKTAAESCWVAVELYHALTTPGLSLAQRAQKIYAAFFELKDAYYDPENVLPFLALHFVHIPTLLARNICRGNRWKKIDMCIGKLTEVDGD